MYIAGQTTSLPEGRRMTVQSAGILEVVATLLRMLSSLMIRLALRTRCLLDWFYALHACLGVYIGW